MKISRAIVVHGCGLDEISCIGSAKIVEVTQENITASIINPEKLGFSRCKISDLQGGDAKTNAQIDSVSIHAKNLVTGKAPTWSNRLDWKFTYWEEAERYYYFYTNGLLTKKSTYSNYLGMLPYPRSLPIL